MSMIKINPIAIAMLMLCGSIFAEELQNCPQEYTEMVTFVPPEGWKSVDAKLLSPNVKALVIGQAGTYPPSINLATENYSGTFKEYLKIVRSIGERKGTNWRDLGAFKTNAGEGRLTQLDTKSEWGDTRMINLILLKDGTVYILTAAALKSDFAAYYQVFFDTLRSLQINRESTTIDRNNCT